MLENKSLQAYPYIVFIIKSQKAHIFAFLFVRLFELHSDIRK